MSKLTREEAIAKTDELIAGLNFEASTKLFAECDYSVFELQRYAYNQGLGGWYYDDTCTYFCGDMVVRHVVKTAMNF